MIVFVITLSGIFIFSSAITVLLNVFLFHPEGLVLAQGKCTCYDPLGFYMSGNVLISP